MKNLTIIYSGEDGEAAQALADKIRAEHTDNKVQLHSTEYFFGAEVEAERVIIMPDVPFFRAMPIKEAYPKAEYTPEGVATSDHLKGVVMLIGVDGVTSAPGITDESIENGPSHKKRGWPKGKPRKKAAA